MVAVTPRLDWQEPPPDDIDPEYSRTNSGFAFIQAIPTRAVNPLQAASPVTPDSSTTSDKKPP